VQKLIFLELNEVNFNFVERYISQGYLPSFKKFLTRHGYQTTSSEEAYENIEPWIQWVSAHSGLSFGEHKIFRLGDIVGSKVPQIWEELERKGLKVGAVSPMNAENRLKDPAFFVPDPWTRASISGPSLLKKIYDAIRQGVRDNAEEKLTLNSKLYLLAGLLLYGQRSSYRSYFRYFARSNKRHWFSAMFLDRFLADVFITLWKRNKPHFSTLFLNGAAHVQHHYMFNSKVYEGNRRNPDWYVPVGQDPLLDVYTLYDDILRDIMKLGVGIRVMMATALRQEPHEEVTYYYRLRDHAAFIKKLAIQYDEVQPKMSRDFVITFKSDSTCKKAEGILQQVRDVNGYNLFQVDNRGESLFVTLTYPFEMPADFTAYFGNELLGSFGREVVFVAIKNAHHDGVGYFADSGASPKDANESFPVWKIRDEILAVFDKARTGENS